MQENQEYSDLQVTGIKTAVKEPELEKIAWLLMKLDSDRRNGTDQFTNKFIGKIESAFSTLPKKIDWQSFYINDLQPYLQLSEEVKKIAIEHKLSKAQTKALKLMW